jgi:hypothetical protein
MTAASILRSGGVRVLTSPLLTLVFFIPFGALSGGLAVPQLRQLANVEVFWVACAGFALIEVIWPCTKSDTGTEHTLPVRIAYAAIIGLAFAGVGYGALSIIAVTA